MTILYYILIFLPVALVFGAAIYTIFKKGEAEGIANYGYIEEDNDGLPKNDE